MQNHKNSHEIMKRNIGLKANKYKRAPFGMSLSKERDFDENMLLTVSTHVTYDTNKAYQNSVMPKIPIKVHMKKIEHIRNASQEELFIMNPEGITSPKKNEKKRLNVPVFARMTGRSARSIMHLKTELSPTCTSYDE